jgi:hypothetical protein
MDHTACGALLLQLHAASATAPDPVLPLPTPGRLATIRGTVVRMSHIRPLIVEMDFACAKCGAGQHAMFPDGRFTPPTRCAGEPGRGGRGGRAAAARECRPHAVAGARPRSPAAPSLLASIPPAPPCSRQLPQPHVSAGSPLCQVSGPCSGRPGMTAKHSSVEACCTLCGSLAWCGAADSPTSLPAPCHAARCIDWQKIRVQELLGSDSQQQGRVPRTVEVRSAHPLRPCTPRARRPVADQGVACCTNAEPGRLAITLGCRDRPPPHAGGAEAGPRQQLRGGRRGDGAGAGQSAGDGRARCVQGGAPQLGGLGRAKQAAGPPLLRAGRRRR